MSLRDKIKQYRKIIESITTIIYIVKFVVVILIHFLDGIKYILKAIEKIADAILIFFDAIPDDDPDDEDPDNDEEEDEEEYEKVCKHS